MSAVDVTLPSGRTVGLNAFGDPMANRIVVMCHPSPGSSAFDPDPVLTDRWGLHLIGLDRPGYGGTEPLEQGASHSLGDQADDIAAFIAADERNANQISGADLEHCGVVGWGTGAVVAASLAVRHPDLVDRLVLVSAPAPGRAEAMAQHAAAARDGRAALGIADDDPAFARHLGLDRRLDRMLEQAFIHGGAGIDGDRALLADTAWVERIRDLAADVLILTGADDPTVDEEDQQWWRQHLPSSARFETVEQSASLTIADAWRAVLDHAAPEHGHIAEDDRDHGRPRLPDIPPQR